MADFSIDTENKLDFNWERFTEEDFNKRKEELINKKDWNGPALIDVGAVNIELHDPEYSFSNGEPRVFLDYYIGGDTSENSYSFGTDIPYGHVDGSSIPISKIVSLSYEEFKSYLENEVTLEFNRINNAQNKILLEAERPTVNFDDPKQGAELYITKLAEKVDLAEQKDRRTWQFVRDNHPGYHDDLTIKSDQIFSDNDVYRSVVAGEMSVESAEKFVELRGTKADFAREFIRTEKEVLDDAIENWQPEEADENGEPVDNVPDYIQEFHDAVNDAYFEMDKAVDIINLANEKEKFLKSFSGWEHNTTLDIDGKEYDQYFIYPEENLPGIIMDNDTYHRLVVDIDRETKELLEIAIDRKNSLTGELDCDVQGELSNDGKKILHSAEKEIKEYLLNEVAKQEKEQQKEIIQEQNLEKLFDGKYSIDDGNSRMSFRETLDFYNKEDADRPYSERLNHAVSRMLYYSLYLPDDDAGKKRWQICDDVAEKITGGEIKRLFDGISSAQEIADKEAKEKFGYSWQEKVANLSKFFIYDDVLDPDGMPTDLDHMIHYFEENTPLEGHRRNLEKAVSHMLMFTIDDFRSLSTENYDDITQDGAAAELRGELCDRIANDLISKGGVLLYKEVEDYSKEIAGREFEKLKEDGRFVEAELAADRAAAHGEADFYSKNFTAGEKQKFESFVAIGHEQPEKLRAVLSQRMSKGSLSDEETSLIDKYLFTDVVLVRFDRDKGDLYLQRYTDDAYSKFTRTSLKGVLELSIENAENAEDAGAVLTLQKRLNELRRFNQKVQKSEFKENSVEKQNAAQEESLKEDVFGDFVSKVEAEYKDLNLFLRSAANVLKQLPSEKKDEVRKELLKRGANTPEKLAVVMRNAIKAKQHTKSQQQKNPEKKRDDYGMER